MPNDETKYDEILFQLAQQSGGVQEFLENISHFLKRHTDFFENKAWEKELLKIFYKEHAKLQIMNKNIFPDSQQADIEVATLSPNAGNGCTLPNYAWTQSLKELEVKIPLNNLAAAALRSNDVNIEIQKKFLKVNLKGQLPIINGELYKSIKPTESTWMLENGKTIILTLEKLDKIWWDRLMLKDPAISLEKIKPETVKLSNLVGEERSTVGKMLQNQQRQQQQSAMNKEDEEKIKLFEKFKESHPELDFSKCKFRV